MMKLLEHYQHARSFLGIEDVQIRLWRLMHRYMLLETRKLPSEVAEFLDIDQPMGADLHRPRSFNEKVDVLHRSRETKKDRDGLPLPVFKTAREDVRVSDKGCTYGSMVRKIGKSLGIDPRTLMDYSDDELERMCAIVSRQIDHCVDQKGDVATEWPKWWRDGYVPRERPKVLA